MSENLNAPVQTETSVAPVIPETERTIPISEVTKTVAARYNAGLEKGRAEAMAEFKHAQNTPGVDIDKVIEQKMQQFVQRGIAEQTVNNFISKMQAGIAEYPDLEQKLGQLDMTKLPGLIPLLNGTDQAADAAYYLANNPGRAAQMATWCDTGLGHIAQMEMQKIVKTIKDNKKASQSGNSAKEPLNQIKPSPVNGGGNDGTSSIAEMRKNPLFRG